MKLYNGRVFNDDMCKAWHSFRSITNGNQDDFWAYLGNWDTGRSVYNRFYDNFELDDEQRKVIEILLSPHANTLLRAHAAKHNKEWPTPNV